MDTTLDGEAHLLEEEQLEEEVQEMDTTLDGEAHLLEKEQLEEEVQEMDTTLVGEVLLLEEVQEKVSLMVTHRDKYVWRCKGLE